MTSSSIFSLLLHHTQFVLACILGYKMGCFLCTNYKNTLQKSCNNKNIHMV
ncbi:hypothetical protein Hanom_Chr00s000003g01605171 [Helianthus anomalus]